MHAGSVFGGDMSSVCLYSPCKAWACPQEGGIESSQTETKSGPGHRFSARWPGILNTLWEIPVGERFPLVHRHDNPGTRPYGSHFLHALDQEN